MNYDARPPPASFDDFLAVMADAQANGGVVVDEGLYEEFFAESDGAGARPEFISSLSRPTPSALAKAKQDNPDCPVCLQTLAAIETEEEYALASESFFGDTAALGLRVLPCKAGHVVCGRCCAAWLRLNNTCPLCRAQLDPEAAAPVDAIEAQRHTERMLGLFHTLFGASGASGGAGASTGTSGAGSGAGGAGGRFAAFGGFGAALNGSGRREEKEEERSAFAGMYS